LDKVSLTLQYNRAYLEGLNPKSKSTFNSNFNSLNSRKTGTYNLESKLQGLREEIYCHFCGEMGHIRKSCVRKQTYNHTKKMVLIIQFLYKLQSLLTKNFWKTARGLTQLRNPQIVLEELIRKKLLLIL